jgi:Eukaryotic protein of unknown function (DUF829)
MCFGLCTTGLVRKTRSFVALTMSPHVHGRPLVILAGWLGCQPRSLRRYEALYKKLGFGVVTRIATSNMVVMSVLHESSINYPSGWPRKRQRQETMQDLAWETLRIVDSSQSSAILFHAFSNGGCFLWEQVKNILKTRADNEEVDSKLQAIQSKLSGVVFDSSPAYYSPGDMSALLAALQHCTWRERIGAYAQLLWHMPMLGKTELEQRTTNYFESLKNDPLDIPQLYLFSKDDPFSQHDPIEELARHRQHLFGRDRILLQKWESSPHCGHFLKHPVEYESAISTFVDLCLHEDTPQSRL